MYEFGFGITSHHPHYGSVINPQNANIMAGGSSGGSAAAVASGLSMISVGTDTAGSVRVPASCCGVYGLKPTFGSVSLKGVSKGSYSLDHIGFMSRYIDELRLLATKSFYESKHESNNVTQNGEKLTIGIPENFIHRNVDNEVGNIFEKIVQQFSKLNVQIKMIDAHFLKEAAYIAHTIAPPEVCHTFKNYFESYFEKFGDKGQATHSKGRHITAVEYIECLAKRRELIHNISNIFENIDAMLLPTMPLLPVDVDMEGAVKGFDEDWIEEKMIQFTCPFNVTGNPVVSIPVKGMETKKPFKFSVSRRP